MVFMPKVDVGVSAKASRLYSEIYNGTPWWCGTFWQKELTKSNDSGGSLILSLEFHNHRVIQLHSAMSHVLDAALITRLNSVLF
jgi:hypothetical protein